MATSPAKSSINILQEFAITKNLAVPFYVIKDVSASIHTPRFEVIVEIDKISCSAQAPNKKQAKESCARLAIIELGIDIEKASPAKQKIDMLEVDTIPSDEPIYNAIGCLNEYASQNSLPYASYMNSGMNEKGLMILECKLGEVTAHGLGTNKKIAKQRAAANLLKKLRMSKISVKPEAPTPEKIRRLICDEIDSATASATKLTTNIKTEEIIIKQDFDQPDETENPEETEANEDKLDEIAKAVESESEEAFKKAAEASEKELLEDFHLKLSNLGLKDDNNLKILKNSTSHVLSYKNQDFNLNVVKICYDLQSGLGNVYNSIKERVQS